jgi:glycerophosphoryl diester phosphodiesterase
MMPPPCPALPPVVGHRGAAAHAPENTLAGLRAAKALGCRWVEFDVRLTADGALILCHDSRLDRTTDRTGRIAALPLAAFRGADAGIRFGARFAGEPIPTLDEALSLARELGLGVNIEIKADRGLAAATAVAVAACLGQARVFAVPTIVQANRSSLPPDCRFRGKDQGKSGSGMPILVSSFLVEAVAEMRRLAPSIATGLLLRRLPLGWAGLAARLGCTTINLDHRRLSPARIAALGAAGYPVLAYTVNDPARARLLFDWGVTSVFSDNPDIILPSAAADSCPRRIEGAGSTALRSRQGAVG